jgi:hypothetical protein
VGGPHRCLDILDGRAMDDQAGPASYHSVPNGSGFSVSRIGWTQQTAAELGMKGGVDSFGG